MKQNESKLLVNDLSARVPFGVKVEYKGNVCDLVAVYSDGSASLEKNEDDGGFVKFRTSETPKPYLRPMTKMDESEYDYYGKMLYNIGDMYVRLSRADAMIDFFNEHHFDYRGLIGKGLALEALDGMYGSFGNLGTSASSEYTKPRAVFPGTFDPFTLAHFHICKKAMPFFNITILVSSNPNKASSMFNLRQRVDMVEAVFGGCDGVEVDTCEGLVSEYCKSRGIRYVMRGLRNSNALEEIELANVYSDSNLDTVMFPITDSRYSLISSTLVRECIKHNSDWRKYVPNKMHAVLEENIMPF